MNSLYISIVAVPERLSMAQELYRAINYPLMSGIVIDEHPTRDSWIGTKLGWERGLAKGVSHIMTIEEDVIVCRDFYQSALQAVDYHPKDIIALYSTAGEKSMTDWAQANGSTWYQMADVPSGQCVIMPAQMVADFLTWEKSYIRPDAKYEDTRLYGYMYVNNLSMFGVVPNLVDHIGFTNSTLGHLFNNAGKHSPCFIGQDVSGLSLDYSRDKSAGKKFYYSNSISGKNFKKAYTGPDEITTRAAKDKQS